MFGIKKKIINRALKHNRREVIFPDLNSIRTVGYVSIGEPDLKQSIWQSASVKTEISSLSIFEGKRIGETRQDRIFTSDLNFWKLPPEKLIHNFIKTPFDLLINMAGNENDIAIYICAMSSAKFKVGYTPHASLYDLVIEIDELHKHGLTEEVIKTLGNLKRMR